MDKISVIVPVYNNEEFLDKCLTSIVNQTYSNLEIILINDGSKDHSLQIMKKYAKQDPRIIILDKKNEGVSKARNDGINRATGKYIVFVDSDDSIENTEIEEMYHAITLHHVDLVRSNYVVHYQDSDQLDYGDLTSIKDRVLQKKDIKDNVIGKVLDGSLPCFVYLLMVEKKVLMKTQLFPTDIHMMEDVVLYIDLLTQIDSMYVLDRPLYHILFNENGATNNFKNYERNIMNIIQVNFYITRMLQQKNLDTDDNIQKLCMANASAIADFIFKQYLSGLETVSLCDTLSQNKNMLHILNCVDYSHVNFQRRFILKAIRNHRIYSLRLYFRLRKWIYLWKRGRK